MAWVSASELWPKLITGKVTARVYRVGRTDFAPIPISPLEFLNADRGETLQRFQIDVCDLDQRRPSRLRPRIPVPHWIYLVRSTLPKAEAKRGAPELYDWEEIKLFVDKTLDDKRDFSLAENQMDGWRSRADLIELVKDHLQKRNEPIPKDTQLKGRVGVFVDAWRSMVGNSR
jgi:hypothetical protein